MSRIRAVVFDMDGVLVDAKEWHYEALNRALGRHGYCITRNEHLAVYDGLPTRVKLQMLTDKKGFPESLHESVKSLKQLYTLEIAREQCEPRPRLRGMLARLSQQGYALGVASNSIRATVDVMLGQSGLLDYLDFTLSNEDVTHPKPHPEIYRTAIERFGLRPDECLVVEDHPYGIESAEKAGAHVLQVHSVDEVGYDRVTARLEQLDKEAAPAPASRRKVA